MVFQEPMTALSPVYTVGNQVAEAILCHRKVSKEEALEEAADMLRRVGIDDVGRRIHQYPFEFSGGQRQRIGIARAIALEPKLIICDEPVSALDVSVQSQILNLLMDLQKELGVSYLFIAHDLAVVRVISDRIGVMYLGKLVEEAPGDELFEPNYSMGVDIR